MFPHSEMSTDKVKYRAASPQFTFDALFFIHLFYNNNKNLKISFVIIVIVINNSK